jgi:hypothetical protein
MSRVQVALGVMTIFVGLSACSMGQLAKLHPAVAELEQRIAGRENEPAEEVFQNIQVMKGIPAVRFLSIMTEGFSPALGVRCSHCHVSGEWHLDEKEPKRIARGMWTMTGEINQQVKRIADPEAQVRCVTCHQGNTRPPTS